ncbi:MAG: hypothetical protein GY751_11260 [Bacteroidetes bacterium]|nr:hypothetical protein [Bacteroidota bacterium]
MNVFKSLYCNQYYELKPKGKAHAARQNGTGLVTVGILFNLFVLLRIIALIIPEAGEVIVDSIDSVFGNLSGRSTGKIIALIPMGLIYFIVRHTLGNKINYDRMITSFETLDAQTQKRISDKGRNYFFISLGLLVIPIVSFIF